MPVDGEYQPSPFTFAADQVAQYEATGGIENIAVFTTQLRDGRLFYAIAVAPRDAFPSYSDVFDRVVGSIQFID